MKVILLGIYFDTLLHPIDPGSKHLIVHLTFKKFKWNFFNFDITKVAWLFFFVSKEKLTETEFTVVSDEPIKLLEKFFSGKCSTLLGTILSQSSQPTDFAQFQVYFELTWNRQPLETICISHSVIGDHNIERTKIKHDELRSRAS